MLKSIEIRRGRHCTFLIHIHLVFVTKYRNTVFENKHLEYMHSIFTKVCRKFYAELVEFNGEKDHVHLLVNYPPKVSIAKLVNSLKGVSSRRLRIVYKDLHRYYWKGGLWSPSYFAGSCGGAPINIVKQYIEQQTAIN